MVSRLQNAITMSGKSFIAPLFPLLSANRGEEEDVCLIMPSDRNYFGTFLGKRIQPVADSLLELFFQSFLCASC